MPTLVFLGALEQFVLLALVSLEVSLGSPRSEPFTATQAFVLGDGRGAVHLRCVASRSTDPRTTSPSGSSGSGPPG